jgi:hypothetical protein
MRKRRLGSKRSSFSCRRSPPFFGLLFLPILFGLVASSSCRLNDSRIRGQIGPDPDTNAVTDATPDAFGFADQNNLLLSTLYYSEIVQITGIDKKVDITLSGDGSPKYRVCSDISCTQEIQAWGLSLPLV